MAAKLRRTWPAVAAVGVLSALIAVTALAGVRWLWGPDRGYAVSTWRSGSGTVLRLYADGTVRGEMLPAEENCWLPVGGRVPYSASGTWEPQLIDSVGPGVMMTLTADGEDSSCYTALAYSGAPWKEQLVFTDDKDLNRMTRD